MWPVCVTRFCHTTFSDQTDKGQEKKQAQSVLCDQNLPESLEDPGHLGSRLLSCLWNAPLVAGKILEEKNHLCKSQPQLAWQLQLLFWYRKDTMTWVQKELCWQCPLWINLRWMWWCCYKWGICVWRSDVCFVYCFVTPFVMSHTKTRKIIEMVRCHQLNIMLL